MGGGRLQAENFVGARQGDAALLRALEISLKDEVRFVDFLQSAWLLSDGSGEGVEASGTAFEFSSKGLEKAFIHFIQTVLVDFEHFEGGNGGGGGSDSLGAGEGVVADPAQKIVGDPRGASATAGDFGGGGVIEFYSQEGCGAAHDRSQVFDGVVVETVGDSESGAKGGTEEARTGGGTDG